MRCPNLVRSILFFFGVFPLLMWEAFGQAAPAPSKTFTANSKSKIKKLSQAKLPLRGTRLYAGHLRMHVTEEGYVLERGEKDTNRLLHFNEQGTQFRDELWDRSAEIQVREDSTTRTWVLHFPNGTRLAQLDGHASGISPNGKLAVSFPSFETPSNNCFLRLYDDTASILWEHFDSVRLQSHRCADELGIQWSDDGHHFGFGLHNVLWIFGRTGVVWRYTSEEADFLGSKILFANGAARICATAEATRKSLMKGEMLCFDKSGGLAWRRDLDLRRLHLTRDGNYLLNLIAPMEGGFSIQILDPADGKLLHEEELEPKPRHYFAEPCAMDTRVMTLGCLLETYAIRGKLPPKIGHNLYSLPESGTFTPYDFKHYLAVYDLRKVLSR